MQEAKSDFYDEIYGNSAEYNVHYKDSYYYVHWTQVIKYLKKIPQPKILEIGCGPGQLAHYLKDEGFTDYVGFDFSVKSIEIAKKNVDFTFFVGNALEQDSYNYDYNVAICLEVLEHIIKDKAVINNIKQGTPIIFSIPNFDAKSHVRWFTNERQLKSRYYKLIDIKKITRIGDIYICFGIVNSFNPNLFQRFLKSREQIGFDSLVKRIKGRVKNFLKSKSL